MKRRERKFGKMGFYVECSPQNETMKIIQPDVYLTKQFHSHKKFMKST